VIVSSTAYDLKKWMLRACSLVLAVLLLACVISFIRGVVDYFSHEHTGGCYGYDYEWRKDHDDYYYDSSYASYEEYWQAQIADFSEEELQVLRNENCRLLKWYSGAADYAWDQWNARTTRTTFFAVGGGFTLLCLLLYAWLHSYSITVTDKRVFGKAAFGKRVELPVDSVSAVATSALKGIAVATSSGRIAFMLIKNRDEIHAAISELLVQRQKAQQAAPAAAADTAGELKKYKELLDAGVISQEEFDAKKKQLLGL